MQALRSDRVGRGGKRKASKAPAAAERTHSQVARCRQWARHTSFRASWAEAVTANLRYACFPSKCGSIHVLNRVSSILTRHRSAYQPMGSSQVWLSSRKTTAHKSRMRYSARTQLPKSYALSSLSKLVHWNFTVPTLCRKTCGRKIPRVIMFSMVSRHFHHLNVRKSMASSCNDA